MTRRPLPTVLAFLLLAACGGGGGASGSGGGGAGNAPPQGADRLVLTAVAPSAPVPVSTNVDLELLVTNPATSTANGVSLSLTLGNGLTRAGVSCRPAGGATCPADPATLSAASLPGGGSLRFIISVIAAAGTSGTVTSTAMASATNDEVTGNNSVSIPLVAYSTEVSVSGSTTASEFLGGSLVPYTFTVSNTGPDSARDVALQAELSDGQTLDTVTCSSGGGATCPSAPSASIAVPLLPVGGTLTFTMQSRLSGTVMVAADATLRATVRGDSNIANNASTVSAMTRIPTSPDMPSFMRIQSDSGDYVGSGGNYSYSNANAVFEVTATGGELTLVVNGSQRWRGSFFMPARLNQFEPGLYTDLQGAPFHNTATGGLVLYRDSNACGPHQGWFQVDSVQYASGQIVAVDIRFEQRCGTGTAGLRGQLHWVANDATRPPGPVDPPPAGLWVPAAGSTPASGNFVYLKSDAGDFVGAGRTELFTQSNAVLSVVTSPGRIDINAIGNRSYNISFRPMFPLTQLQPGYYPDAQRLYIGNPAVGGLSFSGDGRACNVVTGWFVIDSIAYLNGTVTALDARFEQHCEGDTPAAHGRIHWRSDDPTTPPGPVQPPPGGLWTPPAAVLPATGNVVFLQSSGANEFLGMGRSYLYTPLDSVIEVGGGGISPAGNRFQLTVTGDEEWTGFFQAMNTLPDLRAGYYGGLLRFTSHNPATGGLSWYGEGRGCNVASGWFVIDSISYTGDSLSAIELRFEYHCEQDAPALRGYIRWSAADTRKPAPPFNPPPAGLWEPPAGATPATGNYVYLQSDAGDFVGQGKSYLHQSTDALFAVSTTGSRFNIEVQGEKYWNGLFIPMVPLTQLAPGYYPLPFGDNIARGVYSWSGDGRGCSSGSGWFVVDEISWQGAALRSITLRFERRCSDGNSSLHGKIRWRFDDPAQPPPPVNPPPANLWTPAPGAVPATGNFFYVTGDPGEFISGGGTYLFTPAVGLFQGGTGVNNSEAFVAFQNPQTNVSWDARFKWMSSIPRLQPGYYPNVKGFPANPARGMFQLSGPNRGCNDSLSWFVVDSVTYQGEEMTSIDMRFEHACVGGNGAARGRIRWAR